MIAIESKFGWLLAGSTSNIRNSNTMGCHRIDTQSAESQLDSILTKFWETNQIPDERNQDDSVLKTFRKTIKFNDTSGRYSVALPWKENKNDLPSNLNLSVKRLASLQRTLNKRDPELIGKNDKQLQEQLQMGCIEKVPDMNHHEEIVHYIPHFPVFKEDTATTKMRMTPIYDTSAKQNSNSASLNYCLHTRENLMPVSVSSLLLGKPAQREGARTGLRSYARCFTLPYPDQKDQRDRPRHRELRALLFSMSVWVL